MADTLKSDKAGHMFDKVFELGIVPNKKEYTGIAFRQKKWCGYWEDEKGKRSYDKPFCYSFSLSSKIEMNKGVLDIKNLGVVFSAVFLQKLHDGKTDESVMGVPVLLLRLETDFADRFVADKLYQNAEI